MEEGASRYFKNFFDTRLGIVAGGWLSSRRLREDSEESPKEELIASLEEDEQIRQIVSDFEMSAITNILRLDEIKAKDIMVPRTSAFTIDISDERPGGRP